MKICPICNNQSSGQQCRTCEGTGVITPMHQELLDLGFKELNSFPYYLLEFKQKFNPLENVEIQLVREKDEFRICHISTSSPSDLIINLNSAQEVISFLKGIKSVN